MKWKPKVGEKFYTVKLTGSGKYSLCHWFDNDAENKSMIEIGVVFQTKKEAIAATELCLSSLQGGLVRKEDVIKILENTTPDYGLLDSGIGEYIRKTIKAVEEL